MIDELKNKSFEALSDEELEHVNGGSSFGPYFVLDKGECIQCGYCVDLCPNSAISWNYEIGSACTGCGLCATECPIGCIHEKVF